MRNGVDSTNSGVVFNIVSSVVEDSSAREKSSSLDTSCSSILNAKRGVRIPCFNGGSMSIL